MLIHDQQSLINFITTIKNFDLQLYLSDNERSLTAKYEGASLLCISLVFYVTRQPNIIYGNQKLSNLKNSKSEKKLKNDHFKSKNCVFLALSCFFSTQNNYIQRNKKWSFKTNLKTAKRLKWLFVRWITRVQKIAIEDVFCCYGLKYKGLKLAEKFFCTNFDIWCKIPSLQKRITHAGISKRCIKTNTLKLIKKSSQDFDYTVPFLQTSITSHKRVRHLLPICNLRFIGKKHVCQLCNSRFQSWSKMQTHGTKCQKLKFLAEKPLNPCYPLENQLIQLDLPPLQKDNFHLFVTISKQNSNFCCDIFENCLPTSKISFQNSCIESMCRQIAVYANAVSANNKASRLKSNIHVLASLFQVKQKHPELQFCIESIEKKLKQYISHVQIFLCFELIDQILAPKVLLNFIKIHLEQNGVDSCNIKTRRGNLCQVCLSGYSTGLQIMLVHELFPHFFINGQQSHVSVMQNFDTICESFRSHLDIDVTTGLVSSSGHLAKLFFDNEIKYGRCFTMISPSNHLNNLLMASCRYGILQAMTETVIHPFS